MSIDSTIGNTKLLSFSASTSEDIVIPFDPSNTKSVEIKCETYKDYEFVSEKKFTSVYTSASSKGEASNLLTIKADPSYEKVGCSMGVPSIGQKFPNPIPQGTSISYTFYDSFEVPATETEKGKAGGVVIKFKSNKDLTLSSNNSFGVASLSPFANYISSPTATCTVNPPVDNFFPLVTSDLLSFSGSFKANQEYVVTCPKSIMSRRYKTSKFALVAGQYRNDKDGSCKDDLCMSDPKDINAAFSSVIIGSIIIVVSALAALV